MPPSVTTKSTGRFFDYWTYLAIAAPIVIIMAGLFAGRFAQTLITTKIKVRPGQTVKLQPITLNPKAIGALRIDANAIIPRNRWITYEVQIQDPQGKLLAAGRKQGYRESGTWYEDGESGTWSEKDLQAGLDIQAKNAEPIVVAIAVTDYTSTTRQRQTQPVDFIVTVKDGIIDSRYLWGGFWGSLLLAGLALLAVRTSGGRVIDHTQLDSDLNVRAILGGRNALLQVILNVVADETAPRSLNAELIIKDGMGQRVYNVTRSIPLKTIRDSDGDIDSAKGRASFYLLLNRRTSYGFYVKISPDRPIDSTQLIVKEGVKTLQLTSVVEVDT